MISNDNFSKTAQTYQLALSEADARIIEDLERAQEKLKKQPESAELLEQISDIGKLIEMTRSGEVDSEAFMALTNKVFAD